MTTTIITNRVYTGFDGKPAGGNFTLPAFGVTVNCGKGGELSGLSDWGQVPALEAAGLLERKVWKGNGLYGHDTFRFTQLPAEAK